MLCPDVGCLPWKERRRQGHNDEPMCLVNGTASYRTVPLPDLSKCDMLSHTHGTGLDSEQKQNHTCSDSRERTDGLVRKGVPEGDESQAAFGSRVIQTYTLTTSTHAHTHAHVHLCVHVFLCLSPVPIQHSDITVMHCLEIRPKCQCLLSVA